MSITDLSKEDALVAVAEATEVSVVREIANELDISFSGNSGIETIKGKIVAKLKEAPAETPDVEPKQNEDAIASFLSEGADEPIEVAKAVVKPAGPTVEELLEMDPTKIVDPVIRRQAVRAQGLKLRRISIMNNDPSEADIPSVLVTIVNKYLGKVTKLVPFGEGSENGYHVPQVVYDYLKAQKFVLRRKKKGTSFGVPQYSNHMIKKYTITDLPDLTPTEVKNLADRQIATQAIG